MGAMTASIAHEINQPLAAIAANANAGLRWLSRTTPDLEEVHAALKRINNDAHRASEVIQSVRSIFKKAPQQGALVDVNDVVLEVLAGSASDQLPRLRHIGPFAVCRAVDKGGHYLLNGRKL
jgi:C4-dicarboxylate-specific signal transduction histidine kinase